MFWNMWNFAQFDANCSGVCEPGKVLELTGCAVRSATTSCLELLNSLPLELPSLEGFGFEEPYLIEIGKNLSLDLDIRGISTPPAPEFEIELCTSVQNYWEYNLVSSGGWSTNECTILNPASGLLDWLGVGVLVKKIMLNPLSLLDLICVIIQDHTLTGGLVCVIIQDLTLTGGLACVIIQDHTLTGLIQVSCTKYYPESPPVTKWSPEPDVNKPKLWLPAQHLEGLTAIRPDKTKERGYVPPKILPERIWLGGNVIVDCPLYKENDNIKLQGPPKRPRFGDPGLPRPKP